MMQRLNRGALLVPGAEIEPFRYMVQRLNRQEREEMRRDAKKNLFEMKKTPQAFSFVLRIDSWRPW